MGQTLLFILNFEFGFFFLVIVSAMRKYVMGREGGMGNVFVRVRTTSMFAFRLAYVGFVCMIVMSGKERNKH